MESELVFLKDRLEYLEKMQYLLQNSYQYHAEINYEVGVTKQRIKQLEDSEK